jgi:putative ABC transport system permease protein
VSGWRLACRLALRDLRGGVRGLPVFVACLALGVAAIAGIGSLTAAIQAALDADARVLLGGDVDIRRSHLPIDAEARAWVEARARAISDTVRMRAMAVAGERRALVELKAVDAAYPLLGAMTLEPPMPLGEALAGAGAVADTALLARLGLALGDEIALGEARFTLSATIQREPDRLASPFSLGPRLMIAASELAATGLVRRGSLIRYHTKLVLREGVDAAAVIEALDTAFPDADWRLRDPSRAQPGLRAFIDRLAMYLVLIGLTALMVGGIGVASAVQGHLASRMDTIATLKCLGAAPALVFRVYALQMLTIAAFGIVVGTAAGAALPWPLAPVIAERIGIAARVTIYPAPLGSAALTGLLAAALFTLWPLAVASEQPAARLFRRLVSTSAGRPRRRHVLMTAVLASALALLAVYGAGDHGIGWWFVGGALAATALLWAAGWLLVRAARALARRCHGALRFALGSLGRPGSAAPWTVLALGVGLSVLVAIGAVEGSLRDALAERLAGEAPAFFFIDIQRDQVEPFARLVETVPGAGGIEHAPMLRGRLIAINGTPVRELDIPPHSRWLVRTDIGLTFADAIPDRVRLAEGEWWPERYTGPPLVSFDAESARGIGLGVGDRVAFSILGRRVEAEIANLRRVDWNDIAIHFVVMFAPGVLERAPYATVATARASEAAEAPLVAAVGERFPNVSAIPVRAILEAGARVVAAIATALSIAAGVTLVAGVLVLAGVVAAGRRARLYDSVVLKVLGATRGDVLRAYLVEHALLGLAAGAFAAAIGGLAAWAFVTGFLELEWTFRPARAAATVLAGAAIATVVGFAGTWRALGQKPAPILRAP